MNMIFEKCLKILFSLNSYRKALVIENSKAVQQFNYTITNRKSKCQISI
tara:strand:- start:370 stop:516 length:147 start_codon:yes stop_codon:yes gene_type:complete